MAATPSPELITYVNKFIMDACNMDGFTERLQKDHDEQKKSQKQWLEKIKSNPTSVVWDIQQLESQVSGYDNALSDMRYELKECKNKLSAYEYAKDLKGSQDQDHVYSETGITLALTAVMSSALTFMVCRFIFARK